MDAQSPRRRAGSSGAPFSTLDPRFVTFVLGLLAALGWAGLLFLGVVGHAQVPPTAGFDLELILEAGRRVAAGESPYDPALVGGEAPVAVTLFYSYPPPVAQAASLLAGVPSVVAHLAWAIAAVAAFAAVAVGLVRHWRPAASALPIWLAVLALAAWCFPWAVGLVFGNASAWLPAAFGFVLLAAVRAGATRSAAGAGAGLAVASLKLHPASIGLWALGRAGDGGAARRIFVAALATGLAIVVASLLVGGSGPWLDYLGVVRAGAGADLVHPANLGPAAMVATLAGDPNLARVLQWPVALAAVVVTIVVARRVADPVASLAIAATASLVTLPVTWYHYPAALLPFGVAVLARGGRAAWVVAALILVDVALVPLPLAWVAVGVLLWAAASSRRAEPDPRSAPA